MKYFVWAYFCVGSIEVDLEEVKKSLVVIGVVEFEEEFGAFIQRIWIYPADRKIKLKKSVLKHTDNKNAVFCIFEYWVFAFDHIHFQFYILLHLVALKPPLRGGTNWDLFVCML